jgi:hypothetical protein
MMLTLGRCSREGPIIDIPKFYDDVAVKIVRYLFVDYPFFMINCYFQHNAAVDGLVLFECVNF